MKTVYLTSGPRGAGKTMFVRSLVATESSVIFVERDAFLIRTFGGTSFDPYNGTHFVAMEVLERHIQEVVGNASDGARIVLDAWNGDVWERRSLVRNLRKLDVDHVVCWYFVTPITTCVRWFLEKDDRMGLGEYSVKRDFELYHSKAEDIDYPAGIHRHFFDNDFEVERKGFDVVRKINPLQSVFPGMLAV